MLHALLTQNFTVGFCGSHRWAVWPTVSIRPKQSTHPSQDERTNKRRSFRRMLRAYVQQYYHNNINIIVRNVCRAVVPCASSFLVYRVLHNRFCICCCSRRPRPVVELALQEQQRSPLHGRHRTRRGVNLAPPPQKKARYPQYRPPCPYAHHRTGTGGGEKKISRKKKRPPHVNRPKTRLAAGRSGACVRFLRGLRGVRPFPAAPRNLCGEREAKGPAEGGGEV